MTLITLFLIAMLGLFSNWLKKYCREQTESSFKAYMLAYKKNTIASLATSVAAVATIYSTADLSAGLTGQLIGLAFLAGYVGDSAANKGPGE